MHFNITTSESIALPVTVGEVCQLFHDTRQLVLFQPGLFKLVHLVKVDLPRAVAETRDVVGRQVGGLPAGQGGHGSHFRGCTLESDFLFLKRACSTRQLSNPVQSGGTVIR